MSGIVFLIKVNPWSGDPMGFFCVFLGACETSASVLHESHHLFTLYVYKATLLYLSLYCILLQLHVDLIIK